MKIMLIQAMVDMLYALTAHQWHEVPVYFLSAIASSDVHFRLESVYTAVSHLRRREVSGSTVTSDPAVN